MSDSHVYCVQQRSESLYILCVWHPRKNRSTVQGSVKGTEVIHFWSDKTGVLHFSVLLCCHKMTEIRTKTILVEFGERRKPITFCSSGDEMRSLKEGIAVRCCARLVFSNRHVTWAHCPVEIGRLGRYVDRCWRPRNYPWQECGQDHSGVYACVCVCLHASVCARARSCVCVRVCLRTLQKVICNFDICFVISDASQQQKTLLISYTEPLSTWIAYIP